jgi:hypothetical protein
MPEMTSKIRSIEEQNALKVESIHANLETAIAFAKLALRSDDESEVIRDRQKACEAYEEALHFLSTAVLTPVELEAIRTKVEHLQSVLMEPGESI